MNKPSRFPQGKVSSSSVQQMRKQAVAPPVYRPPPTSQVLLRKAVVKQPLVAQAKRIPAAPTVYRPQPIPKVLQRKTAVGQQPQGAPSGHKPVAPPGYRPQPVPKILQMKKVNAEQPGASHSPRRPVAPPVYRPQPVPKVLQAKAAALENKPIAPFVHRPLSIPKVLQAKTASRPYQGISSKTVIQPELKLEKGFSKANSTYQRALIALYQEDMKDLTPEEVKTHGLGPLIEPLLPKLLIRKNTDLRFSTTASRGWSTTAVTELEVCNESGEWKDVDKKAGREILSEKKVQRFRINIILTPGKNVPGSMSEIVQILTHELSVHGEEFINLIDAYWQGGIYTLESEGAQHIKYGEGQNVRYNQLSERMVTALNNDSEDFKDRELADKHSMNKEPKEPVAFDFR